jgi:branched-chain amino acid transport system substrate-binding protein
MIGLQYAVLKQQFGEQLNGVVNLETFVREPTVRFPGAEEFIAKYRERAPAAQVDPLGHYVAPMIFSGMQILEQAITSVGSVDNEQLAQHMHKAKFSTVLGDIEFGADGEWKQGRIFMTQFQNVKGNGLEQFDKPGTQVILYPPQYKSGDLRTPFPLLKN